MDLAPRWPTRLPIRKCKQSAFSYYFATRFRSSIKHSESGTWHVRRQFTIDRFAFRRDLCARFNWFLSDSENKDTCLRSTDSTRSGERELVLPPKAIETSSTVYRKGLARHSEQRGPYKLLVRRRAIFQGSNHLNILGRIFV
jgi:hypothetical protein